MTTDKLLRDHSDHATDFHRATGAPGKVSTTARLAGSPTIVFRVESAEAATALGEAFGPRDRNGVAAGADAAVDRAAASSGSPLPGDLRDRFESSLGADLSAVRIHTGGESAEASRAVGAKAYTTGQDIHFADGLYDPSSAFGIHLLAHEVAHTVQQQGAAPTRQHKLEVSAPQDRAEVEADRAADAMVSGAPFAVSSAPMLAARAPKLDAGAKTKGGLTWNAGSVKYSGELLTRGQMTVGPAKVEVACGPVGEFKFQWAEESAVNVTTAAGGGTGTDGDKKDNSGTLSYKYKTQAKADADKAIEEQGSSKVHLKSVEPKLEWKGGTDTKEGKDEHKQQIVGSVKVTFSGPNGDKTIEPGVQWTSKGPAIVVTYQEPLNIGEPHALAEHLKYEGQIQFKLQVTITLDPKKLKKPGPGGKKGDNGEEGGKDGKDGGGEEPGGGEGPSGGGPGLPGGGFIAPLIGLPGLGGLGAEVLAIGGALLGGALAGGPGAGGPGAEGKRTLDEVIASLTVGEFSGMAVNVLPMSNADSENAASEDAKNFTGGAGLTLGLGTQGAGVPGGAGISAGAGRFAKILAKVQQRVAQGISPEDVAKAVRAWIKQNGAAILAAILAEALRRYKDQYEQRARDGLVPSFVPPSPRGPEWRMPYGKKPKPDDQGETPEYREAPDNQPAGGNNESGGSAGAEHND